ncbi:MULTISPECIES: GNAT family N-acetyltransferase [Paenibacillus]|uniref:GNAT family N-acetyltransferase n=1 Tax=Paenibacillus TaxID=44249 RepID=UPI0007BEE896|nr:MULTISPECIES: GNAT family N-acetyltransferase [Paenibacillus]MCZ1267216.1 GNAT family N-acetyltransferase [Paenibacillus tundrae]SDK72900.1 Ribosomal protein S18 acetylase RimI [Paenibacillus sp. OK060]SHN82564.1 Ribosomal protein S18 acetylase RimI [Paenibacillus sp. ov031]SLJ92418.1 Ribosomal protein S18 acetylase RimI [Paenibacillus sp. RU5A]SOC58600.1 Ribosomal protein S18 acetylase RimI [Paenibacillus sp. RU26A]
MTLNIRPTHPNDVLPLSALMHEYVVGFYNNPWPGDQAIELLIKNLLDQQIGVQFVAEQDGELIGFATLYFTYSTMKANRVAIMNDLFVTEACREGEAEAKLFEHCQQYTREHGCAYMSWITAATNERAQQLFERLGAARGTWVNYSIT